MLELGGLPQIPTKKISKDVLDAISPKSMSSSVLNKQSFQNEVNESQKRFKSPAANNRKDNQIAPINNAGIAKFSNGSENNDGSFQEADQDEARVDRSEIGTEAPIASRVKPAQMQAIIVQDIGGT